MDIEKKPGRPATRVRMTCLIWVALLVLILVSVRICSSVLGHLIGAR